MLAPFVAMKNSSLFSTNDATVKGFSVFCTPMKRKDVTSRVK